MADTFTTILNLTKPEVGASTDTWGTKLNLDLDALDALFGAGPALLLAKGGTGATTAAAACANLGLGSMAVQNASAVLIAGGTLAGITALSGSFSLLTTGPITAGGLIYSTSGGFKFPDGSVQATATLAGGAANWQTMAVNFTTSNGGAYYVTVNGVVVTLHTGTANDTVRIVNGLAAGSSYTINPAGGQTIMGGSTLVVDRAYAPLFLALIGTDWRIV